MNDSKGVVKIQDVEPSKLHYIFIDKYPEDEEPIKLSAVDASKLIGEKPTDTQYRNTLNVGDFIFTSNGQLFVISQLGCDIQLISINYDKV